MEKFILEESKKTPYVELKEGVLCISGKSIPEDPKKFFRPVLDWIKNYAENPEKSTTVDFKFEYCDTGSSKCILDILKLLDDINFKNGAEVKINWFYEEGDEEIMDLGELLKTYVKTPFKLIEMEETY